MDEALSVVHFGECSGAVISSYEVHSGDYAVPEDTGMLFVAGLRRYMLFGARFTVEGVTLLRERFNRRPVYVSVVRGQKEIIKGSLMTVLHLAWHNHHLVGVELASQDFTMRISVEPMRL